MRPRTRTPGRSNRVTLSERVFMAGLAPIFFNLAMIITVVYDTSPFRAMYTLKRMYFTSGPTGWLMVLIPAIVGFLAGIDGSARWLGHAFWTHHPNERSWIATVLVWVGFLLAFGLGVTLLPEA